jgi:hypothetical protein
MGARQYFDFAGYWPYILEAAAIDAPLALDD